MFTQIECSHISVLNNYDLMFIIGSGLLLGGSSDEEEEEGDARSDCSDEDRWPAGGPGDEDEDDLVAGQMEGDGLPTPVGTSGGVRGSSGRNQRRSAATTQEAAAEATAAGVVEGEEGEPREIQLPEECWVEILQSGGVREMCTMGRINK